MKKVVCFGLCFLIVLCSFVMCFADPEYIVGDSVMMIPTTEENAVLVAQNWYYYEETGRSFLYAYKNPNGNSFQLVLLSPYSGIVVNDFNPATGQSSTHTLSSVFNLNGVNYYVNLAYGSAQMPTNENVPVISASNLSESLTLAVQSSNYSNESLISNISAIINGSVSWLTLMVSAVISNWLLLFMCLVIFVGLGIGLFRRFVNG